MKCFSAKILVLCGLLCFFVGGCGDDKPTLTPQQLAAIPYWQADGLPPATGGMVLAVNGDTVTDEEVIAPAVENFKDYARQVTKDVFKENVRKDVEGLVTDKIFAILIYQEAKKKLGDNTDALDKAVDAQARRYVIERGNDTARAEADLRKEGITWKEFKDKQARLLLSQSYLDSLIPKPEPVTYGQMQEVYDQIKERDFKTEARMQFRLIDIQISDANESQQIAAKKLAESLLERIKAGEDFGQLAKNYSNEKRGQEYGGLWKPLNPNNVVKPYDVLVSHAEEMKIGDVAGPIESQGHIFVMKLEDKQAEEIEPLEKVQKSVENRIHFNRQLKARKELVDKLVGKAAIGDKESFIDHCLDEIYKRCKQ